MLVLTGTTYADFIRNMHLPSQLSAVDPIVASFCGGAIGVITTLLLVELYNSDVQAKNRCIYCGVRSSTDHLRCNAQHGEDISALQERNSVHSLAHASSHRKSKAEQKLACPDLIRSGL